jgi:hypothetical protein
MDPAFLTIAELSRLYDQRELSPVEVTRNLFDRIAAHDSKLHSFIRVTPEVALAEAQAAERELMAGRRRATRGTPTICPATRRAAPGRQLRRGLSRVRSAPTPAGRSAGRPRSAASPG